MYQVHNFKPRGVLTAKALNEMDDAIASAVNVSDAADLSQLVNDGTSGAYVCKQIDVEEPIELTGRYVLADKTFVGATFNLSADLFTWTNPAEYHGGGNFIGCTFIGNGNSLYVDGAYVMGSKFTNCRFIDCSIVRGGKFVQTFSFVQCYFEQAAGNTFIEVESLYDTHMIACQAESANKAILIDTDKISNLSLVDCIMEGQTTSIVRSHDSSIVLSDCYFEANSEPVLKILATLRTGNGILRLDVSNCNIDAPSTVYFADIDSSYEESAWARFYSGGCSISRCTLVNTNNLHYFKVEGYMVSSGGQVQPSVESSMITSLRRNSIADFSADGRTCLVKKFPALLTYDSNVGGWQTNIYLVSLPNGSVANAVCLNAPTETIAAAYDSETGFVTVTLHATRSGTENLSATLLNGQQNDLVRRDVYSHIYSGY